MGDTWRATICRVNRGLRIKMATNNGLNTSLSGQTGTGSFVGSTSPTLATPNIGVATATSLTFGGGVLSTYTARTAWTPSVTYATPGDLSVSYATQTGYYVRIGDLVVVTFNLTFTPTFTTASGGLTVINLPVTANATSNTCIGNCYTSSPTWAAGRTQVVLSIAANNAVVAPITEGTGVTISQAGSTVFASGTQYIFNGTIAYFA